MADLPTESDEKKPSPLRDVHPVFKGLGVVDDLLYAGEKAFVTGTLVIMTLAVFLKISHDFIAKQLLVIEGASKGSPAAAYITLGSLLLFGFVGSLVAANKSETFEGGPLAKVGVGLGGAAILFAFGYMVLEMPSHRVVAILSVVTGAVLITHRARQQRENEQPLFTPGATVAYILYLALVAGLIFASRDFEGYSWTSSVSLTLLLWMAFFGASMATYARRHLAIDAIRKAIPTSALRFFNAASYMVTAVATAALLYLSYLYFLSRIGDVTEPGKVPDSWKVLSIPVALAVVTVRFFFYSIGEFILGMLGYEPEEQATIEEVA